MFGRITDIRLVRTAQEKRTGEIVSVNVGNEFEDAHANLGAVRPRRKAPQVALREEEIERREYGRGGRGGIGRRVRFLLFLIPLRSSVGVAAPMIKAFDRYGVDGKSGAAKSSQTRDLIRVLEEESDEEFVIAQQSPDRLRFGQTDFAVFVDVGGV